MQWYAVETASCFSLMPPASFASNGTKRGDDLASRAVYPCKPEQRTRWLALPCARQRCANLFAFSRRRDGADGCSWNVRNSDNADKRDQSFALVLCSSSWGFSRMSAIGKKMEVLCRGLSLSLPNPWGSPCSGRVWYGIISSGIARLRPTIVS